MPEWFWFIVFFVAYLGSCVGFCRVSAYLPECQALCGVESGARMSDKNQDATK